MKKLLMLAVSLLAVAALAGVSVAADAPAAPAKPAHAKKIAEPKMTMGEVTAVTAGKNFSVKDEKGKTHKFSISKKTKIDGELKVGAKVDVTSMGRSAQEVKIAAADAPAEAPAAPEEPKN
jgi:opacity protein-like surface antigen